MITEVQNDAHTLATAGIIDLQQREVGIQVCK